ncbi:MAG: chemotaxis protein CheA [Bacteroidales bacterium]|nr:chemotaxis protein CheA [Bacteroidales bacterium]
MDEFIESFIAEANELIIQLEKDLLNLEKKPRDKELINSVFRVMHTIKGAAGMFGFTDMQNLTHEFENVFDNVRKEKLEVSADLIDITSKGIDIMLALLKKEDVKESMQQVIQQLKNDFSSGSEETTIKEELKDKTNNAKEVYNCYCIFLKPDKGIFERGIDPVSAIEELQELGTNKIVLRENGIPWEKQKSGKVCQAQWEIYLKSKSPALSVENVFMFFDQDEFIIEPYINFSFIDDSQFVKSSADFYSGAEELKKKVRHYFDNMDPETEVENSEQVIEEPPSDDNNPVDAEKESLNKKSRTDSDTTINVSSAKIDELLNLVSELVTATAGLLDHTKRLKDIPLTDTVENIEKLTKQFRNNALDLRLIPVGTLLNKFKRQVRDLSRELNKKVNLIIEGQDTEIDKAILKAIESPLMHIIRNSIDHGVESAEERAASGKNKLATLKITAFYSGANVIIQIHDDGRGINLEKVQQCAIEKGYIQSGQQITDQELLTLIMEPGFTTSKNVSMVSGRGVGMDFVRKQLNEVSGSIEIDTEKGLGTYITLKLPTTLSIIDTLMIEVENSNYLLPLLEVEYCFKEKKSVIYGNNNRFLRYKDEMVPFISLREKFKFNMHQNEDEMVVIINKFNQRYALIVDKVVGEQQTVIKSLGELFIRQPYFSGGNIMVDGKLALILDTNYLFSRNILN